MNTNARSMWIMNIENVIEKLVAAGMADCVEFTIQRYGHTNLSDMPDCDLSELFSELSFIESDL